MRQQMNVSLNTHTIADLKDLAHELGAPVGDLADVMLRFAHEKMDRERLRTWTATLQSRAGRNRGALNLAEKALLKAFERLKPEGSVFAFHDLARDAGLSTHTAKAFDALARLRSRGLVGEAHGDEQDRWGRPVDSVWWRDAVPEVDQSAVLQVVVTMRAELTGLTSIDPAALGMMERWARRTAGWSAGALQFPTPKVAVDHVYELTGAAANAWFFARWPVAGVQVDEARIDIDV